MTQQPTLEDAITLLEEALRKAELRIVTVQRRCRDLEERLRRLEYASR